MLPVSKKYNNQNWLPNFFNDFFDNDWMARTNATAPAINVLENEKSYDIELAAPGMTKDDSRSASMTMVILSSTWRRKRRTMKKRSTDTI